MVVMAYPMASRYTQDPAIIAQTRQMLMIMVLAVPPALVINVMAGTLRAAGDTKFVMWVSIFGVWVVRAPLVALLCYGLNMGIAGAYWTTLADYVCRALCYLIHYGKGKWLYMKV
jgi:Na+-driven multidrug efflux pump